MDSTRVKSPKSDTRGNRYLSQGIRPALTLSIGVVTVGSALAGHVVLNANVSFPLLMSLAILSVVIPRCRAIVATTLGALYGLVLLPVGIIYCIIARKDPGSYLTDTLADVVRAIHDGYVKTKGSDSNSIVRQKSPVEDERVRLGAPLLSAVSSADNLPKSVVSNILEKAAEQRPEGPSGDVLAAAGAVPLRKGRHAKAEPEPLKELAASA